MADLNDVYKVDYVDTVMAAHINGAMASAVRGEFGRSLSISDTLTLADIDYPMQSLTPTGADRSVLLPAEATTNHLFIIKNTSDTYNLVVKNSTAATTLITVLPGGLYSFAPMGGGTAWEVLEIVNEVAPAAASGWTAVGDTWTYASANTVTVPSGAADVYGIGDKVKLQQGVTVKYFYVMAVADTTLTLMGSHTLADAAISSIYYSHEVSPVDFPQRFDYTPTGFGGPSTDMTGSFSISGGLCHVKIYITYLGGLTVDTMPTIPMYPGTEFIDTGKPTPCGTVICQDEAIPSTLLFTALHPVVYANEKMVYLVTADGTPISATVPYEWSYGFILVVISYPIQGLTWQI